jgi:ESS family glutamate:Na+ symporter
MVGIVIRNVVDLLAGDEESTAKFRIETDKVDMLATCLLALFLTCAMMSLDLAGLIGMAAPMLVILVAQIVMMALFALFVTFPLMGRDYAAAVMAGGQVGFGMGSTSNAVANMKSLMQSFGPSPQAYIIVTIVGAFLIDFSNALIITYFINLYK